jgi:endoplasmic reticulum resident protein 44
MGRFDYTYLIKRVNFFFCFFSGSIAAQYHISKYPTLKLFRNGEPLKKEYRGQRSVDALAAFIKEQVKDVIEIHSNLESLDEIEVRNGQK